MIFSRFENDGGAYGAYVAAVEEARGSGVQVARGWFDQHPGIVALRARLDAMANPNVAQPEPAAAVVAVAPGAGSAAFAGAQRAA